MVECWRDRWGDDRGRRAAEGRQLTFPALRLTFPTLRQKTRPKYTLSTPTAREEWKRSWELVEVGQVSTDMGPEREPGGNAAAMPGGSVGLVGGDVGRGRPDSERPDGERPDGEHPDGERPEGVVVR